MDSPLLKESPAPTVVFYDDAWIQAEAASAAKLAGRLYRAAKGGGTVWNGDFMGEARRIAALQNAKLTRALAEPTPLRRALAFAATNAMRRAISFRDFRFWLAEYEGITLDPERDREEIQAAMQAGALFWV